MKKLFAAAMMAGAALAGDASAGSLTWPGYDKWSYTDYGCWPPVGSDWWTFPVYPINDGMDPGWNIITTSWGATFHMHYKECLWHEAVVLPGYWNIQPSLPPTLPGEAWLYTLRLVSWGVDGWRVLAMPDDTRYFRRNEPLGLLREIQVPSYGFTTTGTPWTLPFLPNARVIDSPDAETQLIQLENGNILVFWPMDGQYVDLAAAREGFRGNDPIPPSIVPFDPSLGTPSEQIVRTFKAMNTESDKLPILMRAMGDAINQIRDGWPIGKTPFQQHTERKTLLDGFTKRAMNVVDKLDAYRAVMRGIAAHQPAYEVYSKFADAMVDQGLRYVSAMYQMRRNIWPVVLEFPLTLQQAIASAIVTLENGGPPPAAEPTEPAPSLTSEQTELLRTIANYYEYGASLGWSPAQTCYAICPVLNGPVLSLVLRNASYQLAVANTLRGFSPGLVQNYGGLITTLNALRAPDTITIIRQELN